MSTLERRAPSGCRPRARYVKLNLIGTQSGAERLLLDAIPPPPELTSSRNLKSFVCTSKDLTNSMAISAERRRDIKQALKEYRTPNHPLAALLLFGDLALFAGLFVALQWTTSWLVWTGLLALQSIVVLRLSILGHDAAHRSFTGSSTANNLIAIVGLGMSLHPVSLWQTGHNRLHHGFTSLAGVDVAWIPMSPEEYQRTSPLGRILYRLVRTPWGYGVHWTTHVWAKYLTFAGVGRVSGSQARYRADCVVAILINLTLVGLGVWLIASPLSVGVIAKVTMSIAIPILGQHYLIGCLTYFQHTHPDLGFYRRRQDRAGFESQITDTVSWALPKALDTLIHWHMNHAAHHVDPSIPCYRLRAAQRRLQSLAPELCVVVKPRFKIFRSMMRTCKLYDYKNHSWQGFAQPHVGELSSSSSTS